MKQHGGADTDRYSVDGGNERLGVMGQRIEEFDRIRSARGVRIRRPVLEEILKVVTGGERAKATR